MAKSQMKKEIQDMINDDACEELEPDSSAVHSGNPGSRSQHGRTTPPNSLAIMPDHIFGCGPNITTGPPSAAATSQPKQQQQSGGSASSSSRSNNGRASAAAADPRTTSGAAAAANMKHSTSVSFRDPIHDNGELESPSKVLGGSTSWTGGLSHGCAAVFRNDGTATTSVPLSSPGSIGPNGTPRTPGGNKLDLFKNWTISTYKCSRQTIFEKLGKTNRTVDTELETQIEALRDTQRKYSNILKLARALTSHFFHVVHTQSALGEAFGDLANRSPELQDEFLYNADTQRNLVKNGEQLIGALNFFVSSVNTLCNKTMEDTIATVKQYETARVEYDAYRSDLDFYASAPKTEVNQAKQRDTQDRFGKQKSDFEKLRSDVQIKLKFLDENRVKVMHKQLLLFHNAVSAYFSGNAKALEATMSQFSIGVKSPNSAAASWVEQ